MPQLGNSQGSFPMPIDTRALIERSRGTSMQEITNSGMYGKVKGISGVSALATGESVQSMKSASGRFEIDIPNELLLIGSATAPLTGVGVFLGLDDPDYEFRVGDPAGNYLHWNGSTLTIVGTLAATSIIASSSFTATTPVFTGSVEIQSGTGDDRHKFVVDANGAKYELYDETATLRGVLRVDSSGIFVIDGRSLGTTITGTGGVVTTSIILNADAGVTVPGGATSRFLVDPGSDTDAVMLEVDVTGSPRVYWDESEDGYAFTNKLVPFTNDLTSLGSSNLKWSDLFLASGAVINFNNGDVTLTHSAGLLTASDPIAVPYLEVGTTAALGGGAAPTLGTIGGSGPATAAQNQWLKFTVTGSGTFWVPVWA